MDVLSTNVNPEVNSNRPLLVSEGLHFKHLRQFEQANSDEKNICILDIYNNVLNIKTKTDKHVHEVTFNKQSPILKDHFVLFLRFDCITTLQRIIFASYYRII
jgi:hypothetical protein